MYIVDAYQNGIIQPLPYTLIIIYLFISYCVIDAAVLTDNRTIVRGSENDLLTRATWAILKLTSCIRILAQLYV